MLAERRSCLPRLEPSIGRHETGTGIAITTVIAATCIGTGHATARTAATCVKRKSEGSIQKGGNGQWWCRCHDAAGVAWRELKTATKCKVEVAPGT